MIGAVALSGAVFFTATRMVPKETDRMDDAIIIDGPDPVFKRDNMEGF